MKATVVDLEEQMLPSSYPAKYTFRVVTHALPENRLRIRELIQTIVGALGEDAVTERPSRGGKYWSLHVTCVLESEEQRRDVYVRLKSDAVVLMTL